MRASWLGVGEVGTLREDSPKQSIDENAALEAAKKNVQGGISFQLVGQHPGNALHRGRTEEFVHD